MYIYIYTYTKYILISFFLALFKLWFIIIIGMCESVMWVGVWIDAATIYRREGHCHLQWSTFHDICWAMHFLHSQRLHQMKWSNPSASLYNSLFDYSSQHKPSNCCFFFFWRFKKCINVAVILTVFYFILFYFQSMH